jgi:hypothetical protein
MPLNQVNPEKGFSPGAPFVHLQLCAHQPKKYLYTYAANVRTFAGIMGQLESTA